MNQELMKKAIDLAVLSVSKGGGPFGAVIVNKEGKIVAAEHNHVAINNDPTAHAEVMAIRAACKELKSFDLAGCELYTSCYPCPMCFGAIYWARLDRVWYAAEPQDASSAGFDDQHIYDELSKKREDFQTPHSKIEIASSGSEFSAWKDLLGKVKY